MYLFVAASATALEETIDPVLFEKMEYRFIGPYRGGRSVAVSGVHGNRNLYYMGAAGGGVWKTENAGLSWSPLSDSDFAVGTIGSIAVSKSDPNVIYVGTGEGPIRGVTTSHGKGIYKSTDAGESWKLVGLANRGQIPKIRIHPTNPDIAWAELPRPAAQAAPVPRLYSAIVTPAVTRTAGNTPVLHAKT